MGTLSGFGLVMYIGFHPWQAINLAATFLLLGVGIDDTFVMLSAWERVKEEMDDHEIEDKMEETYRDAAVSITITSLTNVCSFAIGCIVPSFRAVSIFCAYTAVGIVFVYIFTLTFFGPIIVLFNQNGKNELIFLKTPVKFIGCYF